MHIHRTTTKQWQPNSHEWVLIDRVRTARTASDMAGITNAIVAGFLRGEISDHGVKMINKVVGMLLRDAEDKVRYGLSRRKNREAIPDPCQLLPRRSGEDRSE